MAVGTVAPGAFVEGYGFDFVRGAVAAVRGRCGGGRCDRYSRVSGNAGSDLAFFLVEADGSARCAERTHLCCGRGGRRRRRCRAGLRRGDRRSELRHIPQDVLLPHFLRRPDKTEPCYNHTRDSHSNDSCRSSLNLQCRKSRRSESIDSSYWQFHRHILKNFVGDLILERLLDTRFQIPHVTGDAIEIPRCQSASSVLWSFDLLSLHRQSAVVVGNLDDPIPNFVCPDHFPCITGGIDKCGIDDTNTHRSCHG